MAETTVTVHHRHGLHARPAALLYRRTRQYRSTITIQNLNRPEYGEVLISPINLLRLSVRQGDEVRLRAIGEDADLAIADISTLINTNFGD
jgi:phosphocarrier protein